MNLDDLSLFQRFDPQGYLALIDKMPKQLLSGWALGQAQPLPKTREIRHVVLMGMGALAATADLLVAYAEPTCPLPVSILRDYELPAWMHGKHILFVAISHHGETEETLEAFAHAQANGCTCLALTGGGKLADLARARKASLWPFEYNGPGRSAAGIGFGLLLALFARLDLLPDPMTEMAEAAQVMLVQQENWKATVQAARNPAKRLAGQFMGRSVVVLGTGVLAPVALRWKMQVNLLAKAWAQAERLPEASHTLLAGSLAPEETLQRMVVLFLRASSNHPRSRLRGDLTRQQFMLDGLNTDFVDAPGQGRLAQQWSMLLLGEYVAYYLAMAYQVDPTNVDALAQMNAALRESE